MEQPSLLRLLVQHLDHSPLGYSCFNPEINYVQKIFCTEDVFPMHCSHIEGGPKQNLMGT